MKAEVQVEENPFKPSTEIQRSFYDHNQYRFQQNQRPRGRFASKAEQESVHSQHQERVSSLPPIESKHSSRYEYNDRSTSKQRRGAELPRQQSLKVPTAEVSDLGSAPQQLRIETEPANFNQAARKARNQPSFLQRQANQGYQSKPNANIYRSQVPSLKILDPYDKQLHQFQSAYQGSDRDLWLRNIEVQYQEQMKLLKEEMGYQHKQLHSSLQSLREEAERMKFGRVESERHLQRIKEQIRKNNDWKQYYEQQFSKAINQSVLKGKQVDFEEREQVASKWSKLLSARNAPQQESHSHLASQRKRRFDESLITDTKMVPLQVFSNPYKPNFQKVVPENDGVGEKELAGGMVTQDMQYYYQADQQLKEIEELNRRAEVGDDYYSKELQPFKIDELKIHKTTTTTANHEDFRSPSKNVFKSMDSKLPKIASYKGIQNRLVQAPPGDVQIESYLASAREEVAKENVITSMSLIKDLLKDVRLNLGEEGLGKLDSEALERTLMLSTNRKNENVMDRKVKRKRPRNYESIESLKQTKRDLLRGEDKNQDYYLYDVADITNNQDLQAIYEQSLKNVSELMSSS